MTLQRHPDLKTEIRLNKNTNYQVLLPKEMAIFFSGLLIPNHIFKIICFYKVLLHTTLALSPFYFLRQGGFSERKGGEIVAGGGRRSSWTAETAYTINPVTGYWHRKKKKQQQKRSEPVLVAHMSDQPTVNCPSSLDLLLCSRQRSKSGL